jgi:UDP-N-acetylglucosamine 2-epimerase
VRRLLVTANVVPSSRIHFAFLRNVRRLLVTANVIPSSPILGTLMMEALSSFDMSVLTRATSRNIPEYATLHSHRRENPESYMLYIGSPGEPGKEQHRSSDPM